MRVLVTGATGFLGTALCRLLSQRGDEVVAIGSKEADLTISHSLEVYSDIRFDRIFHLAAWTQAGDFCLHHPGEQWLINQQINTNLLRWWQEAQPQAKLVATGTSCTYEENGDLRESGYLSGTPISDLFTYAMTKRMLQVGLESISSQFGLSYLTVVPSTLYGPDYPLHDGKQMHFIFDLMRKILDNRHHGTPIVLWGDGNQKRELVYIDDFIRYMLELDALQTNTIVNIGAGREYSIREFAGIICEIVGVDPDSIHYDVARYVGARSKCLNTERLNSLLPNRQTTSLHDGLKKTVAWLERTLFP